MQTRRPAIDRIAEGYLGSQVTNLREGYEAGKDGAAVYERALEHAGRLHSAGLRVLADDDRRTRMELYEVRESDGCLLRVASDREAAYAAAASEDGDVVTLEEWTREG